MSVPRESDFRTRVCGNCRAKVAADRQRCPRCSAVETTAPPEIDAAHSKRLALISGTLLALALVALGVVYMQQPAETAAEIPKSVPDPLAARRAASAAAVAAAQEQEAAPASAVTDQPAGDADAAGAKLIDQYRDVVQRRPDDAAARTSLGELLMRVKQTEEAVPHFEHAVSIDPQRPEHHLNLGKALAELQRWDEAVRALRRAQQLAPNDSVTTFALAKALQRKGDNAAAVDEFKKGIGLDPNDAAMRIPLAESYEALNQRPQAAGAYNEYLKLAPSGPDADKARLRIARLTSQPAEQAPGGEAR